MKVVESFRAAYGSDPDQVWRAPGRVNLIGEHTDYNGGWALPFALDAATVVAIRHRDDRRVRVISARRQGSVDIAADRLDSQQREAPSGDGGGVVAWARYPLGVVWAMRAAGIDMPGVDLLIDSDLPIGSGLSSSAALQVGVAVALDGLIKAGLGRDALVRICHRAETEFVGAPVGMLDQLAVLHAQAGHCTLIDFRSLRLEAIPLTVGPLVVINTGVTHDNAGRAYRQRREACTEAARRLGVEQLRDATAEAVECDLDGALRRRARHVVTEDDRVLETARRLEAGEDIGELLTASHASLRDDFEVSCPELDVAVDTALRAGASGARLTGAGFGGCAIALGADSGDLEDRVTAAFAGSGWRPPVVLPVIPSAGPARVPPEEWH